MQKNIKKLFPAAAASLAALTSLAQASVDSAQMRNLENRVSSLEQRKGANGMINPPGRPQVRDGVDLFLYGEMLLWNAHQNGMPVAVVNRGSASNLAHSKTRTIHSDWNFGFRVGMGYNTPHDGWDLSLSWLRLNNRGSKTIRSHSDKFVFPSRIPPNDPIAAFSFCRRAHTHWSVHLNQLDFDLGREFFVSKWLTLRPHFGLRTDWVHQKWNSDYNNFSSTSLPNKVKDEYLDNWWGLGVESGLDTQWGLGYGWSLFGNFAGAILYGFHDIDYKTNVRPPQVSTTGSGKLVNLDSSNRVSHPILDMMIGVRYDHMFCNDRFHLGLEIGWEHHVYFSQNQFPVFVDDTSPGIYVVNQGDLTYQGWTVGARFDF